MKILYVILLCVTTAFCWGSTSHKKVLLKDVDSLTLQDGKMTNGRRSSGVPQLECKNEGSASCYDYKPKIVQCANKGSDGVDVQWECKSDMDRKYKFGFIEVTCEGYDYPDDPYILAGSCGLRYTIDHAHGDKYDTNRDSGEYGSYKRSSTASTIADYIVYAGVGLMVYAIYKSCVNSNRTVDDNAYSTTNDDPPNDNQGGGYGWFGGNSGNRRHQHSSSPRDDASCRNTGGASSSSQGGGSGLGGFWTGAATAGILGYMLGGGRNNYGGYGRNYGYGRPRGYGSGFGSGGGMFSGGGSGFGGSSGSHTSTGFGGTSRR